MIELPPLVLGTILNKDQSQAVLVNGLLPLGTLVKYSNDSQKLYTCPLSVIVAYHLPHSTYKHKIRHNILDWEGLHFYSSVTGIEIFPRLSAKDYKQLIGIERGD